MSNGVDQWGVLGGSGCLTVELGRDSLALFLGRLCAAGLDGVL